MNSWQRFLSHFVDSPFTLLFPLKKWSFFKHYIVALGEHTIFGLLGQANLTQNDVLQFHPFTSE
jgi:hypothetical protein